MEHSHAPLAPAAAVDFPCGCHTANRLVLVIPLFDFSVIVAFCREIPVPPVAEYGVQVVAGDKFVGGAVVGSLETPDFESVVIGVDVTDVPACDVALACAGLVAVVGPDDLAGGGVVVVFEQVFRMVLLYSVAHHHLVALVECPYVPAVTVNDFGNLVTQASVAVQCVAHVQHFVLAVVIHIGDSNLVRFGSAAAFARIVLPLLRELSLLDAVGDGHAVEALVRIPVLYPRDDARGFSVEIGDFHHAGHRTDRDVVIGDRSVCFQCAGTPVQDGYGLGVRSTEREFFAITEGDTVGYSHDNVGKAVGIDIIDGCPVPHAHVER